MRKRAALLIVSLVAAGGVSAANGPPAGAAPVPTSAAGVYHAISAKRIIDTRTGFGAAKAVLGAQSTLTFQAVTPLGATTASAVALTLTTVMPSRKGYLVAYSGPTRPNTSTLNYQPGATVANSAVVATDPTGTVSIYNASYGTLDLAVDATGYWVGDADADTAGALHTVAPARLYDSRANQEQSVPSRGDRSVAVAGAAGVPSTGVSAVVLNATVAAPLASGYLSVTQQPETPDSVTSSIDFVAGASRADLVVVSLDADGAISVHNGSKMPVDIALDVVGYVGDGDPVADGSAIIATAYRAQDDRVTGTPVPANEIRSYSLVPGGDASSVIKAAVVTVTVASPTKSGYVVPLNGDGTAPPVSSLNHLAGQTVGQAMIVPVRSDGTISLRNASSGATNLIIDVSGFVLNGDPAMTSPTVTRRVTTALAQARRAAAVRLSH